MHQLQVDPTLSKCEPFGQMTDAPTRAAAPLAARRQRALALVSPRGKSALQRPRRAISMRNRRCPRFRRGRETPIQKFIQVSPVNKSPGMPVLRAAKISLSLSPMRKLRCLSMSRSDSARKIIPGPICGQHGFGGISRHVRRDDRASGRRRRQKRHVLQVGRSSRRGARERYPRRSTRRPHQPDSSRPPRDNRDRSAGERTRSPPVSNLFGAMDIVQVDVEDAGHDRETGRRRSASNSRRPRSRVSGNPMSRK
jgi:hypothetical protein